MNQNTPRPATMTARLMHRIKMHSKAVLTHFPKWFGLYLGVAGLITFNLFIMEEAFQTCMFGSWPAADVGEYRVVKKTLKTMEGLHSTLVVMNDIGGWVNPFAYVSYKAYAQAEVEYMAGLKAKVFANAPEVFENEIVTFNFTPLEWEPTPEGEWLARAGRISILTRLNPGPVQRTGRVQLTNGQVVIDCRSFER